MENKHTHILMIGCDGLRGGGGAGGGGVWDQNQPCLLITMRNIWPLRVVSVKGIRKNIPPPMLSLTAPCRENSKGIRIILQKKYQNLSCRKDMILLSTDHTDDRVWWVKRWRGGGGFETKTNHYFKYLLITMRNIWPLRVVSVKGIRKNIPPPMLSLTAPCRENSKGINMFKWWENAMSHT